FAAAVEEHGFTFIGPSPEHIRLMGDKVRAKAEVQRLDLPTVPGSPEAVRDIAAAEEAARAIGYPVLLKASAGGGGRGMKLAHDSAELRHMLPLAQAEAKAAFGDDAVYLERFLERPRHIEVQLLGYGQGDVRLYGHAIECRINAESPTDFRPSPGRISEYHAPGGLGVRIDSALYQGYEVPPFYDSLVAKLIVHGASREECLMRLRRSLQEYVIGGIETTILLHQPLIENPDFRRGA